MNTSVPNQKAKIEIKGLIKSYGNNHVLDGFNMVLNERENLVIMGKSGFGKSVMIKCLIGLEKHNSGTVEIMGKDISELNPEELDDFRTEVGFLFQGSALYDSMTIRENLEFPLRRHKKKMKNKRYCPPLVMDALENLGLAHTINLMTEELSGGMKRRIALARTLMLQPKIVLYDEPKTGLDPIAAKEILLLMMSFQKKYNTSAIIITRDVDCARVISNRMILLLDGINYIEGTLEKLSI